MRVLAVLATLLGGASAKATKEAVNLQKSGTATELEVAQKASVTAKRDLYSARAEFDALVEEAQLPSGVQIPPGWVVVNTALKPPVTPAASPVSTPKVVPPPPVPRAMVAASATQNMNVVSSAHAVVVNDQPSSTVPQASKPPAASMPAPVPQAQPPQQKQLPAPAVAPAAIPHVLPQQQQHQLQQQHQQQQKQQQKGQKEEPTSPAPAPCWDPSPSPAGGPAAAPGAAADVAADELAGPHQKSPEDDYVPALEGVLVPPAGEAAPVTSAQAVVPPNTLSKIQSVECLEKTLENPEYKCADHHYVGGPPAPQAAVQKDAKKETTGGASAADIEAINEAVKKAEHAAADAKAEAAMAEKYFNDAKEIAAKISKKEDAKPSSFLRHPAKQHHRQHHEVTPPKKMPILIHAKSPVVIHDKKPR